MNDERKQQSGGDENSFWKEDLKEDDK